MQAAGGIRFVGDFPDGRNRNPADRAIVFPAGHIHRIGTITTACIMAQNLNWLAVIEDNLQGLLVRLCECAKANT
jgi:hypothetical protein